VSGHGWMVFPLPRSAGGQPNLGSGNANTNAPCGGGSGTPISGIYGAGDYITVSYARANSHGNTGATVNLYIEYLPTLSTTPTFPAPPSATTAVLVAGATMDVTISTPQSTKVQLPVGRSGFAVIQFHWMPTTGGDWWDCAFVNILTDGVNATNNYCYNHNNGMGDCYMYQNSATAMQSAQCNPLPDPNAMNHTCTCKFGYYGDGITACTMAPSPVVMVLTVYQPKSLVLQDAYTADLALLMCISAGRILYTSSQTTVTSPNITQINFEVLPGANGENPVAAVLILRTAVGVDDLGRLALLPAPVVSVQAIGIDSQPILLGGGTPCATGAGTAPTAAGTAGVVYAATTFAPSSATTVTLSAFAVAAAVALAI